jgi:hypothetical protein
VARRHDRGRSFAYRQPFQNCSIRSIPKTFSPVCLNHERITAFLVVQVTQGGQINSSGEQRGRPETDLFGSIARDSVHRITRNVLRDASWQPIEMRS